MKLLKTLATLITWLAFVFLVFFLNDYIPKLKPEVWWSVPYIIAMTTVLMSSVFYMAATIIRIHS